MKVLLRTGNIICILSMFMILVTVFLGKDGFLIIAKDEIATVCANQFIVAFIITFATQIYGRIKHIPLTGSAHDIFLKSELAVRIVVAIAFVICVIVSCVYFKKFSIPYILLTVLHAVSVLANSAVIKQAD